MDKKNRARILALDALRGLIMILMALDHANFFVAQQHSPGEYWGGRFPVYQETLPFLTRLVTHLAAPGFFFLMGASMVLLARSRRKKRWNTRKIAAHLLIRGGLLIALQLLVVNRAWELASGGWELGCYIGVLFALGGTMILGSLPIKQKPNALLVLTLVLLLGTELLTPAPDQWGQPFSPLLRILLIPGGDLDLWVNYPILPWLELVTFGMLFGHWLIEEPRKAFDRALKIGTASILVFLLLCALDGFGNIRPRAGDNWIDYLNPVKYPPSITFTLLTMGINLVVVSLFSRIGPRWASILAPLTLFGRTPLFFYLCHLFLYAGLGRWLMPAGTDIPGMLPYWLLGLLILAPLCAWYGRFKERQPADSLLRFF